MLPNDLQSMTGCMHSGGPKDCEGAEPPMINGRVSDSGGIFFSDGSSICGDWLWVPSRSRPLDSKGTGDIPVRQALAWLSTGERPPALPHAEGAAAHPDPTPGPQSTVLCAPSWGPNVLGQDTDPREPPSQLLRATAVLVTASCRSVEPACP